MNKINSESLIHGAIVTGIINAVINGIINWFQVSGKPEILLTVDSISNKEHTVMGEAIILAFTLSVIIASIGYFTLKLNDKPNYFPTAFKVTVKNAFFLFGVFVTLAILWQRFAGSVSVSPVMAAIIVGVIAGIVAGVTDYLTKRELLDHHIIYN
jgi:hypothetical protein